MSQLDNEIVYSLTMECSIADHRPCELATVFCMAADISQQEGIALPPKLQFIMDTQTLTESSLKFLSPERKRNVHLLFLKTSIFAEKGHCNKVLSPQMDF